MAVKDLVFFPNPRLVKPSRDAFAKEDFMLNGVFPNLVDLPSLIEDLTDTLASIGGQGLAAPQIGVSTQVAICNLATEPLVLINPTVEEADDLLVEDMEGCISLPGVYVKVKRWNKIALSYQDIDGNLIEKHFEGHNARVIQHEVDHLNGQTIVSALSPIKRDIVTRKMTKVMKKLNQLETVKPGAKMQAIKRSFIAS